MKVVVQVVEEEKAMFWVEPAARLPDDGEGVWVVVHPAVALVRVLTEYENVPGPVVKVMEFGAVAEF